MIVHVWDRERKSGYEKVANKIIYPIFLEVIIFDNKF